MSNRTPQSQNALKLRALPYALGVGELKKIEIKKKKFGLSSLKIKSNSKQKKYSDTKWADFDSGETNSKSPESSSDPLERSDPEGFQQMLMGESLGGSLRSQPRRFSFEPFNLSSYFPVLVFILDFAIVAALVFLTGLCFQMFLSSSDFFGLRLIKEGQFIWIGLIYISLMCTYWAIFKRYVGMTIGEHLIRQLRGM